MNPRDPIATVITAAFNPGKYLREALESALCQTLEDIELIVVDDGSTEDIGDLVGDIAGKIELIRLAENRGPAAARNSALRVARGNYIAILDADDVWLPTRLERVIEHFEARSDVGLVTTDSLLILGDDRTNHSWFATAGTAFHDVEQDIHIFEANFLSGLVVYRRQLFDRYGPYDESLRLGEDWDRNIAFITGGERAGYVDEPLAYYRVHPGNATSDEGALARARVVILERWAKQDLRPEAKHSAERSLGRAGWDVLKLEMIEGKRFSQGDVAAVTRHAGPDVRLKAHLWALVPSLFQRLHAARLEFLARRGGAYAVANAVSALENHDIKAAKRHLGGVVVFGYPIRIRVMAALWLSLPFMRPSIARRLIEDPFVMSLPRPSS